MGSKVILASVHLLSIFLLRFFVYTKSFYHDFKYYYFR